MYKIRGFRSREKLVCVIVFTFLIFVNQLLLVDVFSQLYYLTYTK